MADRKQSPEEAPRSAADVSGREEPSNPMARGYKRAEEKNQEARDALVPLGPDERPGAVTAGALFAGIIAAVFWISLAIRLLTNVEIEGRQPDPVQLTLFAAVMTAMAVGMWRVRYWAVLGFQMLLVIFLLAATLGLMTAETLVQAVATAVLIIIAGYLFFRMIKAMARIQMPQRRPPS